MWPVVTRANVPARHRMPPPGAITPLASSDRGSPSRS